MTIFSWAERRVQRFSIWDIGVFKLCLVSIGMIAGAYLSSIVLANVWLFAAAFLISWGWLFFRMFRRE